MPLNTQVTNISQASVINSVSVIAKNDNRDDVSVFKAGSTTSVYIPLVYNSGGVFTEDGPFYVTVAVYIDALTWINVTRDAGVTVQFSQGRGTLDVLTLPEGSISPNWPVKPGDAGNSDDGLQEKIEEMERNGHYLMLYHLPAGVTRDAISPAGVSDGSRQIARTDNASETLINNISPYCNVYIPLTAQTGGVFNRSGSFYVTVTVQIDALVKIAVRSEHNVLVEFTDGRGTLDIEKLIVSTPCIIDETYDPDAESEKEQTEREIENIIDSGGYIRFYNLPRNATKNSFVTVAVQNSVGAVARCADYSTIAVRKNIITGEAFVPLYRTRGDAPFFESGPFFVTFNITIDAVTSLVVEPAYAGLYEFEDGHTDINSADIPAPPAPPPAIPHCLVIGGLPDTANAPNIADVLVYNSQGVTANCADYTKVSFITYNDKRAAVIPLVYDNNRAFNGQAFAEYGDLLVTFAIFPDALTVIIVAPENRCVIPFSNGSAFVDVSDVPAIPRNCLTITKLPKNIQPFDVSGVTVFNQSGEIAECQDYGLLEIFQTGGTATLRIPLVYKDEEIIFAETGTYYVSFDLNVDALTRILITEADHLTAYFTNGNATIDASLLPQALPVPYFTIMGLPKNTAKGNIAEVFLYNAAGKVAKCSNYADIVISKNNDYATAMIPLAYNAGSEYFRDSGQFVVTFTINVDINTQIVKAKDDSLAVRFTDGSGQLDLSSDYGYFSGELVNPDDTAPPVLKKGTVFEINGGYVNLTANTPVSAHSFDRTCVIYVYASKNVGNVSFEYSATAPSYSEAKRGYYSGEKRALYKTVFIKDTVDKYVAKKYIADSWTNFYRYPVDNIGLSRATGTHTLDGSSNPAPQTYTTTSGWYLLSLKGGGGGGSGGIDGVGDRDRWGAKGGDGGRVYELVYFASAHNLTLFTGSGGGGAGYIPVGYYQGTGGGGGCSGTFVYHSGGYFLCAGGGGGAGGEAAAYCGGAGGGAGGSIGPGGGGGMGGSAGHAGSYGGVGGGYLGGTSGYVDHNIFVNPPLPGYAADFVTAIGYNGPGLFGAEGGTNGTDGGPSFYSEYTAPEDWKNTNGANGQGAYGYSITVGHPGGPGGNNRNAARGGGGIGGNGGVPFDGIYSAGAPGGTGSIEMFRVY